jgi:hypothetical protein
MNIFAGAKIAKAARRTKVKAFISIKLGQIDRHIVVIVEGGAAVAHALITQLADLDEGCAEFHRITDSVNAEYGACDEVILCSPSARAIQREIRKYVKLEKREVEATLTEAIKIPRVSEMIDRLIVQYGGNSNV